MLVKLWIFSLFCLTYGSCANLTKSFLEVNGTITGNRTFNPADGPYLVTSELVVAHNATLTIEAGSEVLFVPNVGVRVHGSLHARGTPSNRIKFRAFPCNETVLCNNTNLDRFYNPGIRLVDGTSHSNGRLEIQSNGQWGTICNTYWDYSDTAVACRQLGFLGAKRHYTQPGSGPVYMKNVHCNGKEKSLWDCRYTWRSCYHSYDVGIECDTLMPLMTATVYWKGIYFVPTNFTKKQGNSFLENTDIVYAFEGIKALKKVPDLLNVTIRDGASGFLVKDLKNDLAIKDTTILRLTLAGANIESSGGHVLIVNTAVQNTRFGAGFVYNRILDAVDFCSIVPDKASLPFVLKATGKAWTVNCSKVFRARPGGTLSVHFRSIAGTEFELNVTDGSAYNNTLLFITDEYNGKTVKTASSSVLELSFYSKGNSKVPAKLEMIILQDQGWPPSLLISNSTFSNNFKSGIEVYDLIGYSQISNTVASKNGRVGLHISRAQGSVHVLSSVLVDNQNHGAHIESMSGSVVLETVSSSKNQESGIVIESGTFSLLMSDSHVNENLAQGLYISSPLDSTMNISNTKFLRNSGGQGMYFKNFLEDCQILLSGITSLGNSHNGALFERVKAKSLNVTTSSFDGNTLHGLYVEQILAVSVNFQEISTSYNLKTGVFVNQGSTNMNVESWSSIGNQVDGFYLENQEGQLMLKDCYVYNNKRNGLWLVDSFDARLQSTHLQNCSVLDNSRYGVLFVLRVGFRQSVEDYNVTVANSTIANNALGGCWFYPSSCSWSYSRHRRVQLSFIRNKVEGNQKFGLNIHGPEWYELTAVLANNEIRNNSGNALKVAYYDDYCRDDYSFPVHVRVLSSTFIKNLGEYTVLVDYNTLPTKRYIVFNNNSFIENRVIKSFSSSYVRTKTQAVLAVKEATITVEHNSFVNPLFPHEMATMLKDHERVIQARNNWWGSKDECKVEERIFHFVDRVELAQIQYYPFLDSVHSKNFKVHNRTRRSCFFKGNKLGGTLNQTVTLPKDSDTYQVIGDVIVLPNGILTIEENVTLEFPLKAVFIVFGKVVIKGTDSRRVKFIPKGPLRNGIRLVGSTDPWDGILEIWFNNTWLPVCLRRYRYEYTIVCRQLGYEALSYSYRYSNGKETFLHNVQCDTHEIDSIIHCNRKNWMTSSSCSGYVAYIRCKTPYWTGVHLTITPKKSDIRNVDIDYAGFAYRDDLRIPGIALRVDLNKHNISGVLVNNSANRGVQMMYPDPFKVSPDITNSKITNTEGSGILLESPFLNLATTNVVNTKGYGFTYYYSWKPLNDHVFKITDMSVKKNIDLCSGNDTFIDNSSVVYYLVVRAKIRHACKKVVTVPQDYNVRMQLIHHDVHWSSGFHVYSGTKKSLSILWDVHRLSWRSRPTWKTNSSSVLFESLDSHYHYSNTVHFVLFLIKETDKKKQWWTSANLIISKSNFISNDNGGVYLGGEDSGHILIQSSVVQDSTADGVKADFSHVKNLKLFNCSLIGNQVGIRLSSFSGNVNIENTNFSNSTSYAIYIASDGQKLVRFLNSSVIHSEGFGIYLKGNYEDASLIATNSFFGWNKATSVYSDIRYAQGIPGRSHASFKNCTFLMNRGPVVNIDESPKYYPWKFEGNIFMNNTDNSVIMTTKYTESRFSSGLFVRRNKFLFNVFQEKGVIYVKGGTKELIIDGNVFEENYGRSVFVEEQSFFHAPAAIQNNVFKDNSNSKGSVLEIRRMENDVIILNNVFKSNEGLNVILLHNEYYGGAKRYMTFVNNSLLNNSNTWSSGCEVEISGMKEYKVFSIHHNRFNSQSFSKEFCVNITANSHTSYVNVSLNYWGYDNENQIQERIYDAEDNYERALAAFIPFFGSTGELIQGSNQSDGLEIFATRYLGGRISSSLDLWSKFSPYKVMSDITVLPDAKLTIHPGVELQFVSGVGMLILGALLVLGNRDNPVTFSLLRRNQMKISIPVRLVEGTFPWQGRLEVLHNGNWNPVCVNETIPFGKKNAKVICGQLGYRAPSTISYVVHLSSSERPLGAILNCNGNETEINECPLSLHNLSRNSTRQVALDCKGGTPWGNLRFLREFRNTSYPMTSKLQHLKIQHCGEKHGKKVAAIEMIQTVPEMVHVSVLNCTTGGVKVLFPEREVYLRDLFLVNTGGYGGEMLITKRNFTLEKVTSMNNTHGLRFRELDGDWIDGVTYGQVLLCDPATNVTIKNRDLFLYVFPPLLRYLNLRLHCQLMVKTDEDAGFALQLLVMKNVGSITIENARGQIILKFSSRDMVPLSRLIPWNGLTVYFEGWYSSEMLLQVQRMELKDMPCTFERSNCGWRQYPRKYFRNVLMDWQWRWYDDYDKPTGIPDHTYLYNGNTGNYMWFGHHWYYGYGAFSSPAIFKESDYCSLEFYYQFWRGGYRGRASLSVFIEQLTENSTTSLWSTSELTMYWKKKVVKLPQAFYNYSVVFLGYFQDRASIVVDDIQFVRCNFSHEFTHRITESILSGNSEQGISYTSTHTKNHLLRIERCKITNNGGGSSGAIYLNAINQAFELFNNHLGENRNGSLYSRVHYEETESRNVLNNHIHGNTFDSNRGVSLFLEGITGPYFNVKVTNNYFSDNFAEDPDGKVNSVCRITNIRAHVQGNFFYNNIGRYAFEYSYAGENAIVLQFLNNTLYKNSALGLNVIYGVTILCNAAAEMHGNVIQNPGNRYQISTTWQGEQITVNATSNWWGESVANLIAPLIMDKTKDYRLTLTVSFKPFVQLPPQRVISVSCPPEWIKDNELCFLYKGSSFSFAEAKTYCQGYGGNIIAMFSDEDKRLVKHLRREESIISSSAPPSLWTMKRDFMRKSYKDNGVCSVLDSHGNITASQCDSLYPFVCIRRPVIHCPNGCFHNGDCIGATCFCYPGWTGEDCSRFHCHDLHNCSGNGKCMGPNACKCYPGYLGLGCTYSFCEKYESCSDCVTDPFCGWCDSSRSCLGGFAEGPPKESCPDWFYYHCYTVGDEGRCSSNIPIVDCRGKHCNFRNGRGTTESCQKCQDLDKCYKIAEEGECRSWNETRCPGGQVMVDYTDPQRNENVELAENVKFVEPNTTLIYACPVIMAQDKHISLVFVAPKVLDVQAGNILCSPQAGGIMHKITSEATDGPFRVMMSVPAGFEEVIKYADFKKEATVEDVDDDSTLEDEPDEEALENIISGNITLNVSQIIVLPNAYKCLGHTYEIGNLLVHSYYLIVEKNITVPKKGDIVASNVSSGFIESVAAVHKSNDTGYLETKFQRCNENSQLNATRLKQSERRFSQSVFCSGGDNNQGLVISAAEESAQHFAVNDSIVGRPSRGYIAKVVKVNSNGEFFLLEVISAKLNGNGTVSTAMDVNRLQSHHRRTRRSSKEIDLASFQSRISHKMLSTGNAKMQVSMSAYLSLTAFVEIESKLFGFGIKDATAGLKLEGGLDFSFDISVDGELRYTGDLLEMKDKQLGGTKYIRFGLIKLPVGIFLGMTGQATASISGSLRRSLSASGRVSLGGECSWSEGSCYTTDNSISLGSEWSRPKSELKTGAKIDVTVTPTISVKVPVMPKRFENGAKRPSLSILDKIVVAAADIVDLSLSLFASVPLKAGISMTYPSRQCRGKTPAEIEGFYGISDLIFGVRVGFLDKQLRLSFNTGFSLIKWTRDCICPTSSVKMCVGPPSQRPPPPRPPVKTPPKPPEKKQKKKKKTDDGSNQSKIPRLGCGEDYVCAKRRRGPNCTQPDMYPNQDCSKNGKPVITLFCGAECECFGGWEGEYCERISANGGGDPHLETLDGVNFDFFGIGEFWGCKSVQNDFGLQFRFYYYERASLIGGVALKAGKSVVTVMTIKTDSAQDTPILRIDGMLINITSNSSKPIDINNGTVLLDRQRRFTFEAEENSVALISLQYDSGVTVTIDVRHSRVMKRQYLNVLYSPTAAYKGNTEGLCGFMDNNATNDFTGPDGILYKDAVQFAESWRIKACHNGSGRFDSWSWNSSNFNHEDTMDLTYTDPSYIPVYSLDGIPNSLLEVATTMCKSLNISNNDLHSCIFDVAITNDTTFTDQETFKRDCPAQCSGKGRCVNGTCRCIEGWTGESCDKGSCLNCSTAHGNCVKGFCVCDLGWEGRSCELKATCHNVSNCTSPVHGVCKTTDVCQCNPGYIGRDCSVIPTCFKVSNCTGNGLCVDFDVCKCNVGWTGTNCTQYSCEHLDYCSEHGRCVALDECACDYGWTGASCALPDCPAVNQCSGKGECVASNLCRCYTGFLGASCSEVADCSEFANCSGRGVCVLTEALNVSCSCYTGFTGANCSQPTCTTMNNCSNHGACIEAELCKCDMGYNGTDCSNFSCEAVNSCSGNGECVGYDICRCNNSWSGRACSIPDCSSVNNCSAQGECILPDTCACYPAFDGEKCDQKAKPNTNAPSFDQMFYNATIVENSPVGTMILQVHANDTDMGRNGHVFYTVVSEKENEDSLAIGGTSGKLYSTSILDFETIKAPSFNVAVVASDDGFPQKSGVAVVQITVVDENDNCPTFIEPSGKLQLEFSVLKQGNTLTKVSATDLDSGINSDITYSMSRTAAFTIDPKSGVITTTSNLTTGLYHLTVSASDNGGVSCKTEASLTVKINGVPTKEPLTSPASSSTHKVTETSPRDTQSTSMSTELTESTEWTEPTAQFTSTASGDEVTASPQNSPNYIIIGASAAGGVLLLVIIAVVIRKCLCKTRTSSAKEPRNIARVNDCLEGEFELSNITGNI